jgi:hypothetical protein
MRTKRVESRKGSVQMGIGEWWRLTEAGASISVGWQRIHSEDNLA